MLTRRCYGESKTPAAEVGPGCQSVAGTVASGGTHAVGRVHLNGDPNTSSGNFSSRLVARRRRSGSTQFNSGRPRRPRILFYVAVAYARDPSHIAWLSGDKEKALIELQPSMIHCCVRHALGLCDHQLVPSTSRPHWAPAMGCRVHGHHAHRASMSVPKSG